MASRTTNTKNRMPPSYYDVLMVAPDADMAEIRDAYYTLAKKCHPDRNPRDRRMAELRFRLINEAYENLKTPQRRAAYDRKRKRLQKRMRRMTAGNDNTGQAANRPQSGSRRFLASMRELLWPIHTDPETDTDPNTNTDATKHGDKRVKNG